ncbi:MAG: [LysW]-aminoadipate/[LysW]-glutamate kinase [Aigarchaeota archaeon]|nr:[LysW]-aminoadipate/[LysW]-glutamate kinase [Aigarchaeota archaeon]MDW7985777.1 [LysW]-aminoadipate/[LysW]-glutamate kinase [Nitrososphaerota archaeon]
MSLIVVKVGGRALEQNIDSILESIGSRVSKGLRFVLVHGGGDTVTRYEKIMGVQPRFVISPQGIRSRYTDERELEVYVMVMAGRINKDIVAKLNKMKVKAIGLTGVDGGFIKAERKKKIVIIDENNRKKIIPGGYTGMIKEVEGGLISNFIDYGYLPVIAPIALGEEGEMLNVDADQVSAKIAESIKADKLVVLTDVDGVIVDGKIIKNIRACDVEVIQSKIGYGMNRKVLMCAKAVQSGVGEAVISSGLIQDPLMVLEEDLGTKITL